MTRSTRPPLPLRLPITYIGIGLDEALMLKDGVIVGGAHSMNGVGGNMCNWYRRYKCVLRIEQL